MKSSISNELFFALFYILQALFQHNRNNIFPLLQDLQTQTTVNVAEFVCVLSLL